ncbi:MAG: PEGA domain-containing protein [Polyangia bacterium]
MKKGACMILALALTIAGATAFAGARQHFMAGQDYYTQGRYEKAIEEFKEAYRLDPRPLLLYNIAQAHEKLGDLYEAVDYLKRYLEAEPDSEDRTTLLNKVANLEARIAKTGVEITCNQAEATVYVDGEEKGKTPISEVIALPVGAHKVQVSKQGFADFTINVGVSAGQTTPVEALLEPGETGPAPVPAAGGEGEEGAGEEGEVEEEEEEGGVEALDVVPWAIAGVGAAAAIVGFGVVGGMAMGNDDHDQAVIADIIGWPGVALAAGGTIWGVLRITGDEESPADDSELAVIPVVGDKTAGVSASITF